MGKRGPAPTPTAILKLHGSRLAKGRADKQEPQPPAERPEPPVFRNDDERQIYEKVLAQLERIPGLVTVVDGVQLERYIRYLDRWRTLETELERFRGKEVAALMKDDTRRTIRLLWMESRLMDTALKQIEDDFGMSPKARVGLYLKPAEKIDPLLASVRKRV